MVRATPAPNGNALNNEHGGSTGTMYAEIHRHLVLYKKIPNSCQSLFRQIVVVEREHFEVRVLESDIPQLDTKFVLDSSSAEIQLYKDLSEAVRNAENNYKESVRQNWRAFDPSVAHSLDAGLAHRASAA